MRKAIQLTGDIQHVHDPVLIRHGGKWHAFSTGTGIPYRVSDDGRHWKYVREVFPEVPAWGREAVPGVRNPWAPDISFRDGRFWLYYSLSTFGSQVSAVGLATADRPDAPRWDDHGLVFQSRRGDPYNAIDPNAFAEKSGRLWLTFGSFWKGIFALELDPATGKPAAGAAPRPIAARPRGTAIEAPFVLERDGWIYCFAAADFCCRGARSTYKTIVGRSRSFDAPFVDRAGVRLLDGGGTVVARGGPRWRGPGHPGLARDGRTDWLAVHAYDAQADGVATLRLAKLRWRGGWPEAPDLAEPPPDGRDVPGTWEHTVDGGAAQMLVLTDTGAIDNAVPGPGRRPAPAGTWERDGDGFAMVWPHPDAPGGAFRDRCRLTDDRRGYTGANQRGQTIAGVRVA